MTTTQEQRNADIARMLRQASSFQASQAVTTSGVGGRVEEGDIVQGQIYWLPAEANLPKGAVSWVRGKGAIEEGIYSHPVVIVSRPAENNHTVHFQLVS